MLRVVCVADVSAVVRSACVFVADMCAHVVDPKLKPGALLPKVKVGTAAAPAAGAVEPKLNVNPCAPSVAPSFFSGCTFVQ
jgi:hypothetical protein